ncbi:MAG TPA: transglycosylase SLT domain-containing protein, partial [Pyrinomonadaceae bacterium]|nr:transglycosylase SLT domain-containing protein [Pyrinomonadaceae bacterium]
DSLLAASAYDRMARNSFEKANYSETIRILTSRLPQAVDNQGANPAANAYSREIQALLGKAYLESGQPERAREIFTALIDHLPNPAQPDDVAQTAANGLDLMDVGADNFGKKAPEIAEAEHLRRANIYQFNRDFPNARLHYEAIIGTFPNSASSGEAAFQIGRGLAQMGTYVEALTWYERVQEQYPESSSAKDALLQAAAAYSRVGKPKEAIKRYQRYIEKYPTDEKLDRAYMNIVDIYRDQGEDQDALKWCAKAEEVFKGKVTEAVAIFAEARIYIVKDDWQNALASLERLRSFADLGGERVPGGTSVPEVTFLKGFALEQMKRYGEAIDVYLSIADGRSEYYGWRATERLRAMAKDQTAGSFISQEIGVLSTGLKAKDADERRQNAQDLLRLTDNQEVREKALGVLKAAIKTLPKYSATPNFKLVEKGQKDPSAANATIADQLQFLGLMDEAVPEIEASAPNVAKASDDNAFTLAANYLRGDRGDKAIAFMEPVWKKVPAHYPVELIPRAQFELLYPAVYQYSLLHYAPGRQVDPRLILAIMRQEARFQPDAKSYAAARGLMQFIAATSTRISTELGRDSFAQDELYYPPTATLFGAQYLADLFKIFPGQPEAVAASYNGGDDNVKRWLLRSRSSLPERYVPEIMFAQSKDYVYKVMANYRMYQFLYDENLRPH